MTTEASELNFAPSCSNVTSLEAATLHWHSWHISGEKRSLFHCYHKQLLWTFVTPQRIWSHSANFCGVTPGLHCELFPLECSAESHQPAPCLKVMGWSALGSRKEHYHGLLLCGCKVDSERSLPPAPLRRVIERNHGYECSFTQPHIQYASVEFKETHEFKTLPFLLTCSLCVSNRRVKNRKIFTVRELKENREHRRFIRVQGNGILP